MRFFKPCGVLLIFLFTGMFQVDSSAGESISSSAQHRDNQQNNDTHLAESVFTKGEELYYQEKFDQAKPYFEKSLELEPNNAETMCWLAQTIANILEERAKKGASRFSMISEGEYMWELFRKAVELDPKSERARIGNAVMLRDVPAMFGGNVDEAERILLEVVSENPENVIALHHLGTLYVRKKNEPAKGIHYLREVIRIERQGELNREERMRIPHSYNALGAAFMNHYNKPEVAVEYLEKSVELDPDNVPDLLDLVHAYEAVGKTEQAKKTLRTAVELINRNDHILFKDEAKKAAQKLNMSRELVYK